MATVSYCGCEFLISHIKGLVAVNPRWEIISREKAVLWMRLLGIYCNIIAATSYGNFTCHLVGLLEQVLRLVLAL